MKRLLLTLALCMSLFAGGFLFDARKHKFVYNDVERRNRVFIVSLHGFDLYFFKIIYFHCLKSPFADYIRLIAYG